MFTYKGRAGPSRQTPANVTCQKCLKKGHYSYECKSSAQERPYVSRPSRSQQLRNPKLVPKLTNDKPDPLEKKEGVADAELARIEAERSRKRMLEERDDELVASDSKRRKSFSSASSVSTISTRDSASPPPRRREAVSPRQGRAAREQGRSRSLSRSASPPPRARPASRDSRSPAAHHERGRRTRDDRRRGESPPARARRAPSLSMSRSRSPPYRSISRSPERDSRYTRDRRDRDAPSRRGGARHGGQAPAPEAQRERSLSPFSKRLALTRSANQGK